MISRANFIEKCFLLITTLFFCCNVFARDANTFDLISIVDLPKEAQQTLVLIKRGGPFPYPQDGVIFGNREGILQKQKRGYYHEFTVKTPGVRHRGARRIIVGGELAFPQEFYYTDDHYSTFKRISQ